MKEDIVKIGKRIRNSREKKGLTQENVAELVGISERAYGSIERGKTCCSLVNLIKIVRVLGLSMDYLLFDKVPEEDKNELHKLIKSLDIYTSYHVEQIVMNYIAIHQHK